MDLEGKSLEELEEEGLYNEFINEVSDAIAEKFDGLSVSPNSLAITLCYISAHLIGHCLLNAGCKEADLSKELNLLIGKSSVNVINTIKYQAQFEDRKAPEKTLH